MIPGTTQGRGKSGKHGSPTGWQDKVRGRTNLLVVLASLAVGLAGFSGYLSGDHLHVNGIAPWDASVYASLARDLYAGLERIGPYHVQRILPSAIIYYVFRLFHVQPTDSHLIVAFIIFNALCITVTGYLFTLIADHLALSVRGKWLGFIGLFFNFAILKHQVYSPILTDTCAYAVGMLMFYFYLTRNDIGLVVSTIIGAFVWPTLLIQGILLLIFFRQEAPGVSASAAPPYLKKAALIVSALFSLFALVFIIYLHRIGFKVALPHFQPAFYLSLALVVLYIFWGMKTLLSTGDLLNINRMFSHSPELEIRCQSDFGDSPDRFDRAFTAGPLGPAGLLLFCVELSVSYLLGQHSLSRRISYLSCDLLRTNYYPAAFSLAGGLSPDQPTWSRDEFVCRLLFYS